MATSIRAQCRARLRGIMGIRLCQKAPFEDEFNLIEAEYWGVNEKVNFRIYIGKFSIVSIEPRTEIED